MSLYALSTATVNGQSDGGPPQAPGLYDIELVIEDARPNNMTGRFTLSVPQSLGTDASHPLVVVLHYAGQPTRFYGRPLIEELFEPAWRDLNAIYLAPESLDGQWNTSANEAWVLHLLDTIKRHYAVDAKRIVVAGYSMGAIGSWHFINSYPERFSAAVPIAGMPRSELACSVPVYTLAAPSDEIFAFDRIEAEVNQLKAQGCAVELQAVDARGHYDVSGFS